MHELTSAAVALMVCVAAGSYLAGCCNGTESRFQWHTNGPGRS